jgi:hypothetical protein
VNFRARIFAILCATLVGTLPSLASAACTQQDAMTKAQTLSQLMQTKMAKDPSAGQAIAAKMQPIAQSYAGQMGTGTTIDWDKVCSEYDDLIKQAQ